MRNGSQIAETNNHKPKSRDDEEPAHKTWVTTLSLCLSVCLPVHRPFSSLGGAFIGSTRRAFNAPGQGKAVFIHPFKHKHTRTQTYRLPRASCFTHWLLCILLISGSNSTLRLLAHSGLLMLLLEWVCVFTCFERSSCMWSCAGFTSCWIYWKLNGEKWTWRCTYEMWWCKQQEWP